MTIEYHLSIIGSSRGHDTSDLFDRDPLVDVDVFKDLIGHVSPGVELGGSSRTGSKSSAVFVDVSELNNVRVTIWSLSSSATSMTGFCGMKSECGTYPGINSLTLLVCAYEVNI